MDFAWGVTGFVGYESLRVYKVLWGNLPVVPAGKIGWYCITVLGVAAFAGAVAEALAGESVIRALLFGFSVPTGIKAILEDPRTQHRFMDDDISVRSPGTPLLVLYWLRAYFG